MLNRLFGAMFITSFSGHKEKCSKNILFDSFKHILIPNIGLLKSFHLIKNEVSTARTIKRNAIFELPEQETGNVLPLITLKLTDLKQRYNIKEDVHH